MSKYQEYYRRGQAKTRCEAIEYQSLFENGEVLYWSDIAEYTAHFKKLGKRFGLMQEFAENAII